MSSRIQRKVGIFAVIAFVVVGLVLLQQNPSRSPSSSIMDSIHDIMNHNQPAAKVPAKQKPAAKAKPKHHGIHDLFELESCTAVSPLKGFIDLRGLSALGNDGKIQAWQAKGFAPDRNFSIGICSSAVKRSLLDTADFGASINASEVGAFYVDPQSQEYVSLGQVSSTPVYKGRKLTMTYENGSYCENIVAKDGTQLRRSTILTFTCDRDTLNKAHVSYIASAQDCTYMFEIRSHFACPTAAKADNLAAIWIFFLILLAALMVFFSGSFMMRHMKRSHGK